MGLVGGSSTEPNYLGQQMKAFPRRCGLLDQTLKVKRGNESVKGRKRMLGIQAAGLAHGKVCCGRLSPLEGRGAGQAQPGPFPPEGQHHQLGAGEPLPSLGKRPGERNLVIPVSSDRRLWTSSFKCVRSWKRACPWGPSAVSVLTALVPGPLC